MTMTTLTLKDRSRGSINLNLRDGIVVGACGSEPACFMGLTESQARHLARYGAPPKTERPEVGSLAYNEAVAKLLG
jgi:hypothetical protein